MCATHWRLVPKKLQKAIWEAYHDSPTHSARFSSYEYLCACADAVEHIAALEGRLPRNTFRGLADLVKKQHAQEAST